MPPVVPIVRAKSTQLTGPLGVGMVVLMAGAVSSVVPRVRIKSTPLFGMLGVGMVVVLAQFLFQ